MDVATVTTTDGSLLRSVRGLLREAKEALMCVAFVTEAGVHLLSRELQKLRSDARLLVTTTFGTTTIAALNMAVDCGLRVGLLNLGAGQTFHPKLYLGKQNDRINAVVGSANLTGGLVTNVEVACHVEGEASHPSLRDAWNWANRLWKDDRVQLWTKREVGDQEPVVCEPELYEHLRREVARDRAFMTLGPRPQKNAVTALTPSGLYVETAQSRKKRIGPQLVPAWMVNLAWDYLRAHKTLSNRQLLEELNVHRSSAVCAILARLPGVRRASGSGIVLEWVGNG